jgi:hypothetical protein
VTALNHPRQRHRQRGLSPLNFFQEQLGAKAYEDAVKHGSLQYRLRARLTVEPRTAIAIG